MGTQDILSDNGELEKKRRETACPPEKVVYDPQRGVRVCIETGEVLEESVITDESEWRAYTAEEKMRRARTGGAISFAKPHMGINVNVGPIREPGGKKIRGLSRKAESLRVQRTFRLNRVSSSVERSISQALMLLDELVAKLELPDSVKEEAARIYREAAERGITRGRSMEAVVAACLYTACRRHKIPCGIDDIVRHLRSGNETEVRREIARTYRVLIKDLSLTIPVIEPERFVYRIASALNLSEAIVVEAIRILSEARSKGISSGKDPSGLAAATVYIAALKHGCRRTQKEIANIAGVTEVTVRNRYKELIGVLGEIEEPIE
ncbi:MAG: transcription initiation factor IIB [Acidilobaceae archaeon]